MYHWVNKDEESAHLSRSEGSSAALIHRFVRTRRSKSDDVPGTAVWSSGGQIGESSFTANPSTSRDLTRSVARRGRRPKDWSRSERIENSEQSQLTVPIDATYPPESKTDEECAKIIEGLLKQMFDATRVHSANVSEGSAFDPFASTVAPITKSIHSTLTYFWINAPRGLHHYKLEVLPRHLQPFQDLMKASREMVLNHVFTCKHVFYSVLAAFEIRKRILGGETTSERNTTETYIAMATASIREKLAERQRTFDTTEPSTLSLMIGITYLAIATGLNERLSEIHIHLRAMMSLARDLESQGSGVFEHWLVDGAASICTLAAVKTGTPVNPLAVSESVRLDTERLAAMKVELGLLPQHEDSSRNSEEAPAWSAESPMQGPRSRHNLQFIYAPAIDMLADASQTLSLELGSGFESALAIGILDPSLRTVLCDVLDNLIVAKYVWKCPERCDVELTQMLCRSNRTALSQLTRIDFETEFVELIGTADLLQARFAIRMARCVKIALIIMLSCAAYRIGRTCCLTNTPRLKEALLDLEKLTDESSIFIDNSFDGERAQQMTPEEVCNTRLLFWVVMTGHFASQGMPEEQWFAEKASSIAVSRLKLESYADLHELMSTYIYSWTVQERSLRIIADRLSLP